jgi:hypothetical protein
MGTQKLYRRGLLRAPPWVRGVAVSVLALILVGNLVLITFSWAHQGGTRIYALLAILWILALVGILFLLRLWRAIVLPRQEP